jgi:hypothetical protein
LAKLNKITIYAREEEKISIKYSDIIVVQDYSLSNTHFIIIIHPFNNQVSTSTLIATALQLGLFVAVVAVTASAATECSLESVFYHHNLACS